ncbi:MAG: ECF-type sigma factor [Planctomycetota bacterium]|jgi:RNA polymerase sigma factor (TIGR02999 family)
MTDVTRILNAIEQGDKRAADKLLPLVYEELRLLAAQRLSKEKPGQTLQATALVHEAYIRLVGTEDQSWDNKGHFFKAAAEAMRRILIENARRKKSAKHGGDQQRINLDDADLAIKEPSGDLIVLDEALTRLSETDPGIADLVKLRYFAGLTIEQVAQFQGLSRRTAVDHWAYARAWLRREISKGSELDYS